MDPKTLEWLRLKTLIVLFEHKTLDTKIEDLKAIIKLLIEDLKFDSQEIVFGRVHPDATLLKSASVIEKGFPLLYLIRPRRFVTALELAADNQIASPVLKPEDQLEVNTCLNLYFRGCEMIPSSSISDILRTLKVKKQNDERKGSLFLFFTSI